MEAGGHQAGDVRHVHHERRTHLLGNRAERRKIDDPRVRAGSRNDHLGPGRQRLASQGVVVDPTVLLPHPVVHDVVHLAAEVHGGSVGEVAAMAEIHPHDAVARLQEREVPGHVGLRPGVRLHVGVVGPEQRLRPVTREVLCDVDDLTTAVVPASGESLGVLVREDGAHGLQDRA